jgi:hypothetical protein
MGAKAKPPLWQYFWRDGRTPRSGTFRVDLPEMSSDLSGRHAVFSTFDYTSAA